MGQEHIEITVNWATDNSAFIDVRVREGGTMLVNGMLIKKDIGTVIKAALDARYEN